MLVLLTVTWGTTWMYLVPSVWPHNPATGFRPPSATVVSTEPFWHRTGTLRCLQKEMATYRHWTVSLWRDPDDVSHCRILSHGKAEWRRGLVICELRTGELVICELIVRTTDANLGYNANQKVRTFYAIKRGFCIRNAEITFITIQNAERNRLHVNVTKIPQN